MSLQSDKHLDYDELLMAAVEADDLPAARREHLDHCLQCKRQLERTAGRLESIGRLAARLAPDPAGPVRIHARRKVRRPFPGRMKSMLAMALVAMLVVFVSVMSKQFFGSAGDRFAATGQVGRLIADVNRLVDNPLPTGYSDLASVADPVPAGDPTAFIVPEVGRSKDSDLMENERIAG